MIQGMRRKVWFSLIALAVVFSFGANVVPVEASRTQQMGSNVQRHGLDVGPGSFGVDVKPGDSFKREVQVTNWAKKEKRFLVEVEDFEGVKSGPGTINLSGKNKGRFSAKDWFHPEVWEFTLQAEERFWFDVEVNVPMTADAGDHYASVLITMLNDPPSKDDQKDNAQSTVVMQERIGVLVFARVAGAITEEGKLNSFEVGRPICRGKLFEKLPFLCLMRDLPSNVPVEFRTVFENTGSVRLKPSGTIEIRNMLGRLSGRLGDEEPYNVLRDSVRQMNYEWEQEGFYFGKYTAELKLNRGYGNIVDTKSVAFWVIPWRLIISALAGIILVFLILKFIGNKFEFKIGRKKKG